MKFYEPGTKLVVFDVVPPRQYVGYDAYKKDWQDFFGMFDGPITFDMNDLAIETGAGDLAFSHSIQHVAGKSKQGGNLDLTVRVTDDLSKDCREVADRARACLCSRGPGDKQGRRAIKAVKAAS